MAYQTQSRGNYSAPRRDFGSKPAQAGATQRKVILSTGLFAPNKEGVKSLANIQLKEDVVLPAGSYINLYPVEKKGDKSPVYRIQVTEGKLKPKANT